MTGFSICQQTGKPSRRYRISCSSFLLILVKKFVPSRTFKILENENATSTLHYFEKYGISKVNNIYSYSVIGDNFKSPVNSFFLRWNPAFCLTIVGTYHSTLAPNEQSLLFICFRMFVNNIFHSFRSFIFIKNRWK